MEVLRANIGEKESHLGLCRGFFFLVVGGSGCGCGRGLSVMSLKSSGHGGFESKYQREGEASSG